MQAVFRWAFGLGMVAAACGGSSDLDGFETSPSTVGGAHAAGGAKSSAGGALRPYGGAAIGAGGFRAVGGGEPPLCAPGNQCSTPGAFCAYGPMICQCANGTWSFCQSYNTGGAPPVTGGRPPVTGGRPALSGGTWSGGRATGGMTTGGSATGGACAWVDVLPSPGAACSNIGSSYCDITGKNRCVCAGTWYCSGACDPAKVPTPNTPCSSGMACDYPALGTTCACVDSLWVCAGGPTCPATVPSTGDACAGLTNLVCDYPGSVHLGCACLADSSGTRWVCITLAPCPENPPVYSISCDGPSLCSYGSLRCGCLQAGTLWTCV